MHNKQWMWVLLAVQLAFGCADEFSSYEEVTGFRVLALGSDKPTLVSGESTVLDALLTVDGESYRWSWCPLLTGSFGGFECAFSQDELQTLADESLGPGVVFPDYDLGTDPTAAFEYSFPPELVALVCAFFTNNELPEGAEFPACEGTFPIKILLDVESGGERITAVRDLDLAYELDVVANENPQILSVSATDVGQGVAVEMAADTATMLALGREYEISLEIPDTSAQSFPAPPDEGGDPIETREDLTATWFYRGGEFDKSRSSFFSESDADFERLRVNTWLSPSEGTDASVFAVLRDGRGGVTWVERDIILEAQ